MNRISGEEGKRQSLGMSASAQYSYISQQSPVEPKHQGIWLMYAVETRNLVKQYGKTYALKGLNFTINPQEIMVLLGPNGSGKTTLLMTLATVLNLLQAQRK